MDSGASLSDGRRRTEEIPGAWGSANLAVGQGHQPPSGRHAGHACESVHGVSSASGNHLIDKLWACWG